MSSIALFLNKEHSLLFQNIQPLFESIVAPLALAMYHVNVKQCTGRACSSLRIKVADTIVELYQEGYCRKNLKDSEF